VGQAAGGPYLQPLAGTDLYSSTMPTQEPPPILVGKAVYYSAAQHCAQTLDVQECVHTLQGNGRVNNVTVTGHCQLNQ
jgi:hypothetical protein